jgi:hypothetical protein
MKQLEFTDQQLANWMAKHCQFHVEGAEILFEGQYIHVGNCITPDSSEVDLTAIESYFGYRCREVLETYITGQLKNPHSEQIPWGRWKTPDGYTSRGPGRYSGRKSIDSYDRPLTHHGAPPSNHHRVWSV